MDTFAERLRKTREGKGLTQDGLAKLVDRTKSQSIIANLESGANKSSTYLPEIAHILGVDAYWLKTGKGHPVGKGKALSPDEELIVSALSLISEDLRESWLDAARRAVERAGAKANSAA